MKSKHELRETYKNKRRELTTPERDELSLAIANQILILPIWEKELFHLFLPIERLLEIDTSYILQVLQGKDKQVVFSKTKFETQELEHYLLTDSLVIKENKWGIPEPQSGIQIQEKQLEVIFIPLLTFDNKGHRIGYGKGFYDRFLEKCSEDVIKIGLSFFEVHPTEFETLTTDIPLNYCVTPKKTYEFQ